MKPDWIIHYILADRPSSHTHGLDRHGSLELELNLPVPQEKAQMILNLLGLEITEKDKCYRSGDMEDDIFTLPVYFFETTPAVPDSCFSRVMRVLVCDPDGKYPWEPGCEPAMRSSSVRVKSVKWRRLSGRGTNASQDSCGKA